MYKRNDKIILSVLEVITRCSTKMAHSVDSDQQAPSWGFTFCSGTSVQIFRVDRVFHRSR